MTKELMQVKYTNKGLQKATDKIRKLEKGIQTNLYETAAIIAYVDNNQLYLDDGFKNVHEWTKTAFDIEKSTSYNMLKIGNGYTRELTNGKGKIVGYKSNLTDDDKPDYNVSQIVKMLPVPRETLPQVIYETEITPSLSCKEIETRIRNYMNKDRSETATVDEDEDYDDIDTGVDEEKTYILTETLVKNIYDELLKVKTKRAVSLVELLAEILGA